MLTDKKKVLVFLLFFIVFISLLPSFVSRLRFFENELYVKIFSEEICFDFQKHSAHKDILKEA